MPLDQVSSQRLVRASGEYQPRTIAVPSLRAARPGPSAAFRFLMAVLLPPCFFALAGVMFFGLARGTAGKLAGDGGMSAADAALVLLLVIAAFAVFTQGLGLLRRHPRGRKLLARGGAAVPRRQTLEPPPTAPVPLLLDQVTTEALQAVAPPGLGSHSGVVAAGRAGWRTGDTLLWVVLGAISVAVAAFAAFGMGFSVWRALQGGSYTPLLVMLAAFCAMAFFGLSMMARITILAIFDRRRRKRRPAFLRLTRSGAKPMADSDSGMQRNSPTTAVVTGVAMVVLLATAFWPEVSAAFEDFTGDDGSVSAASQSATATPSTTAAATTFTPTSSPPTATTGAVISTATAGGTSTGGSSSTASPPPSPVPATPSATATSASTATATSTSASGATATPTPTSTPTSAPTATSTSAPTATPTLTPTRTPTPSPTATPTPVAPTATATATPLPATPTATLTPPPDSDGDGLSDALEVQYGSSPQNPASTPEDAGYDAKFGANTCSDGVNNDLMPGTDTGSLGIAGDPGCLTP